MFRNATPKRALLYLSLSLCLFCLFGLRDPFDLFGALSELSLTRVPVDNFRVGGVFQKAYFLVNCPSGKKFSLALVSSILMPPAFRLSHMNSYISRVPKNWRYPMGSRQKNGCFTARLTVKVRGISPLGPDVKIWAHFFHWNLIFWYSIHILSHCEGLKNAFFMPFTPPLYCYPTILWQSSSKQ